MTPYKERAGAEHDGERGEHHEPPGAASVRAIEPEARVPHEVPNPVTHVITECRQDNEQQKLARRARRKPHGPRIAARASRNSDQSRDKQEKSYRQCNAAEP